MAAVSCLPQLPSDEDRQRASADQKTLLILVERDFFAGLLIVFTVGRAEHFIRHPLAQSLEICISGCLAHGEMPDNNGLVRPNHCQDGKLATAIAHDGGFELIKAD